MLTPIMRISEPLGNFLAYKTPKTSFINEQHFLNTYLEVEVEAGADREGAEDLLLLEVIREDPLKLYGDNLNT